MRCGGSSRRLWTILEWEVEPLIVLSHRGNTDGRSQLENTMPAFEAAVAEGAEGIETDVRLLADGSLVLHHDRLSPSRRPVWSMNRQDLEAELGHRLATPAEALAAWPDLFWNLEIKATDALEPLLPVLATVGRRHLLLSSFLHDLVASVDRTAAKYAWGVIQVHRPADAAAWAEAWKRHAHVEAMVWDYDFLAPRTLEVLAAAGFDHYCYGMQSREEHRACQEIGVAGTITNHLQDAFAARILT